MSDNEILSAVLGHQGVHIDLRPSRSAVSDTCETCAEATKELALALNRSGWTIVRKADLDSLRKQTKRLLSILDLHSQTPSGREIECLPGCIACSALNEAILA